MHSSCLECCVKKDSEAVYHGANRKYSTINAWKVWNGLVMPALGQRGESGILSVIVECGADRGDSHMVR